MQIYHSIFRQFIYLLILLPAFTFAQTPTPALRAGTIHISGEVSIPEKIRKDSVWVQVSIPQPFTGELKAYKALLDRKGRFSLKAHTSTNVVRGVAWTDINRASMITILLQSGKENKITFAYDEDAIIHNAGISGLAAFTEDDLLYSQQKFHDAIDYRSGKPIPSLYDQPFGSFIEHANNVIQDRRHLLDQPPFVSGPMKDILYREYSMALLHTHIFEYHSEMVRNYSRLHEGALPDPSSIYKPVRQDYSFLKSLDLNNPLYLLNYAYPAFAKEVLQNGTLDLPPIGDMPLQDWFREVKTILSPFLGFHEGLFYDLLAGNAYGMQFELELKPLSDRQVENIKKYYKGSDMEKILLRRNQQTVQQARLKDAVVMRPTPDVSPEAVLPAILSQYKGKTVVVDFWATWCIPCLEAIEASRSLKKDLAGKDVVFIYLSNPSSPKKLWEKHIQGIGGEQYYLTTTQWKHILETHNFNAIPTYLIFDKQGELKLQMTGYPGNKDMRKLILDTREGRLPSNVQLTAP